MSALLMPFTAFPLSYSHLVYAFCKRPLQDKPCQSPPSLISHHRTDRNPYYQSDGHVFLESRAAAIQHSALFLSCPAGTTTPSLLPPSTPIETCVHVHGWYDGPLPLPCPCTVVWPTDQYALLVWISIPGVHSSNIHQLSSNIKSCVSCVSAHREHSIHTCSYKTWTHAIFT